MLVLTMKENHKLLVFKKNKELNASVMTLTKEGNYLVMKITGPNIDDHEVFEYAINHGDTTTYGVVDAAPEMRLTLLKADRGFYKLGFDAPVEWCLLREKVFKSNYSWQWKKLKRAGFLGVQS